MKRFSVAGIFLMLMIALFVGFPGCKEAETEPKSDSEIVMAKDSELALLMRDLTTETEAIRAALERGEEHPLWSRVEELHTATPTDSTRTGPVFEGFSNAFIRSVREMENADSLKVKHFNAVINTCMDCHRTYCPGPMKRIEKFYLKDRF